MVKDPTGVESALASMPVRAGGRARCVGRGEGRKPGLGIHGVVAIAHEQVWLRREIFVVGSST